MIQDNPARVAGPGELATATPMNEAQKRWADGLKQLELVARNAKQVEAIDVLHAACQEMAQQQIQRDALLTALRMAEALLAETPPSPITALARIRAAIAQATGDA